MQKQDAASGAKRGKVAKRSAVTPFVKHINLNHVMPTRYVLDITSKIDRVLDDPTLLDKEKLSKAKKSVRNTLEERYRKLGSGETEKAKTGATYFFRRLRF